jgi:hypothetical protein
MYACNAPPDIDDAVSTFKEPRSLVPEVMLYALSRGDKCLVNMDALLRKSGRENACRERLGDH